MQSSALIAELLAMDEKIIHCVPQCPNLWDTRLLVYEWREISQLLNLPGLSKVVD